jgi:uncharacterized protein YkwD
MYKQIIPQLITLSMAAWVSCAHGSPVALAGNADPVVEEFVGLLNEARRSAGCAALVWDADIAAIARAHSADMVRRGFFSHDNPDGVDPFERLRAAKIDHRASAENILEGATSGRRAFDLWMGSPGHRANMMNCAMTHHGVGRVDSWWTHVFVRR